MRVLCLGNAKSSGANLYLISAKTLPHYVARNNTQHFYDDGLAYAPQNKTNISPRALNTPQKRVKVSWIVIPKSTSSSLSFLVFRKPGKPLVKAVLRIVWLSTLQKQRNLNGWQMLHFYNIALCNIVRSFYNRAYFMSSSFILSEVGRNSSCKNPSALFSGGGERSWQEIDTFTEN